MLDTGWAHRGLGSVDLVVDEIERNTLIVLFEQWSH